MLHTVKETAEKLNVSETTVYGLVARGSLASHRIGVGRGTVRITQQAIDRYLTDCRETPPTQPGATLRHLKV